MFLNFEHLIDGYTTIRRYRYLAFSRYAYLYIVFITAGGFYMPPKLSKYVPSSS